MILTKNGRSVTVIKDAKRARKLVASLLDHTDGPLAIDFETTGLDAKTAQVRLSCISTKPHHAYVIDHFHCGSFASFADDLAECGPWDVFGSFFEGMWFDEEVRDAIPVELLDVGMMRKSVQGGGPLKLMQQIKWDLGIEVSKELQNSDWSAQVLTNAQYLYGGEDAIHTRALGVLWREKMSPAQYNGFRVMNGAWRAVNECKTTGLLIDEPYHKTLISMWTKRKESSLRAIRRLVPESQIANINSNIQISNFLKGILDDAAIRNWPKTEKTEQLQTSRDILRSMSVAAPYPFSRFLTAMMVYNRASKYLSTYGETLLTMQHLSDDGRIHGRVNIAQAITGRTSSSAPNTQNIPNSPIVRRSFIAGDGRVLILADYSGVEVRVLAEMSGDKVLLHDCIYDDVHSRSAIAIYKIIDEVFIKAIKDKESWAKAMRGKAKGFTFQLLYGAGAAALSIVLRCSIEEAENAISAWANRYQKAFNYRTIMFEQMMHSGYLTCASGRTIYVNKRDRAMPIAANYPIQGSAGDVIYCAMTRVHDALEYEQVMAKLMASVHDEILLLSYPSDAEKAKELLVDQMKKGWLDIFPGTSTVNLVEASIGKDWSDKL